MFLYPIPRRWIISLLGIYSCALMYVQRAGFSVAIIRMTGRWDTSTNFTQSTNGPPRFEWNETVQGIILGASFYLYWIVPTIVGSFTEKYGGKWFAFIGVFIPFILNAIIPWAATLSLGALIMVQIWIGITQAFTYPALFHLYVQWFQPNERSKANSGIQIGVSLGSSIIYLIGGFLCETSLGWPMIFYVGSAFHVPWIFLWLYFASDKPNVKLDGKIPMGEKPKIMKRINTPWLQIAISPAVWSSIFAKSACSYGFFMFLSKLPAYLNSVYDIEIVQNGFINAAISLSYGVTCFLAPYVSNYMIHHMSISVIATRKICQSLAMLVPAFCLIIITLVENQKNFVIALLIIAMLGYGFVTGGEWTMVSDYAPNFVGAVSGVTLMLAFINGILAPYIVGMILDSHIGNLQFKWNVAFYISAAFYVVGYLFFWILGTDQQQKWDIIEK